MNIPINKDIDDYKQDFWKGLSLRECAWGGAALIVGGGMALLFAFGMKIPINIAVMMASPFVVPIGINGFYSRNGMSMYQIVKAKKRLHHGAKPLTYRCRDIRDFKFDQEAAEQSRLIEEKKGKKHGTDKTKAVQTSNR